MTLASLIVFAWSLFGLEDALFGDNDKEPVEAQSEGVEITARRSDLDKNEGVVMFEGDAFVRYAADYNLHADRLFAFFNSSNELERIVALGDVAITNRQRHGECAMAQFRRGAGEIELYGDENALASLAEEDKDALRGKRIKFWIESEQVQVDGSEITIENGGKGFKL